MVFFSLVSALSFFILFTLGIRVLQDHGGKLSLLFGLYALAAAYVSLLELLTRLAESEARAAFWGSVAFLWPLAPALFLHFTVVATIRDRRSREVIISLDYLGAALLAFLYYRYFESGEALVWRYGWTLTSPVSLDWPWIVFTILIALYVVGPLLLFLFRVIRPGGTLSRREQRWLLIGYAIRFAVVLFTPLVAALFDVVLPELNSAAYAVFAVFIYIGISRSFFLSLTPQRSIGSILATMEEFLFLTTPRFTVVFANDAAERLLGAEAGTLHGKLLPELFGLSERRTVPEELRYLDTQGEWRDLQILSTEVSSTSGGATGYVFLGRDVSEDRRREAALRETVLIKESVLRELHHRLYNTLQTVTSLLHLKAGTAATSETTEALSQSASRVDRMAQVYRLAHEADDFTAVSFDDLLDRVTMDAYQAYPESREIKFSVTADPAALDVSLAVPLLLIAGELVENAVRHAFPASPSKSIRVEYRYQGPREWQLTVSDNGVGLPETANREKGGLLMVEALAEQAGACMRIDSTGGTMVAICTNPPSAPSQNR